MQQVIWLLQSEWFRLTYFPSLQDGGLENLPVRIGSGYFWGSVLFPTWRWRQQFISNCWHTATSLNVVTLLQNAFNCLVCPPSATKSSSTGITMLKGFVRRKSLLFEVWYGFELSGTYTLRCNSKFGPNVQLSAPAAISELGICLISSSSSTLPLPSICLWYMIWYDMMWCDVTWCDVMWCGVVWYGMVWYGMARYGTIGYDTIRYDTKRCDVMWCDVMWCDVMWCDVMWCDVMWCDMVWYGMIWYYMIWHDMTWHDMTWHDMTWHDMTWHDMTWHDMTW